MTRGQGNNSRRVYMSHKSLQFTREDVSVGITIIGGSMGATIVKGLNTDGITGSKGLELTGLLALLKNDKSKHTIELTDGGGSTELGVGMSDDLAITARDALLVPAVFLLQIRIKRVVVVDLSVGSEVDPLTLESQVEGPEMWVKGKTNTRILVRGGSTYLNGFLRIQTQDNKTHISA